MMIRRLTLLVGFAAVPIMAVPQPAAAQFGGIVFDPRNYAQNILTAARTLQQVNNQIRSLQNEAQSLTNQARNLASLPVSSLNALQAQVRRTQQLLSEAQRIAYDVRAIDRAFSTRYGQVVPGTPEATLVANARGRWQDSVGAFEDAMRVQAGVVGNIDGSRATMDGLVTASQSASGALQAAQAGNQLLALQTQQLADLTATIAAQGRAQSIEMARQAAAETEGRSRFRRFVGGR